LQVTGNSKVIIALEFEVKGNEETLVFFMVYGNFYGTLGSLIPFCPTDRFSRMVDSR
jgi:hypothetical protein